MKQEGWHAIDMIRMAMRQNRAAHRLRVDARAQHLLVSAARAVDQHTTRRRVPEQIRVISLAIRQRGARPQDDQTLCHIRLLAWARVYIKLSTTLAWPPSAAGV